jgi:hypothetical protein
VPNVTIEVKKRYSAEQEERIIGAVHAALMEGLKTPEWDRTIRLVVHDPRRFATARRCLKGGDPVAAKV